MFMLIQYVQFAEQMYLAHQVNALGRLISITDDHILNPDILHFDIPTIVSSTSHKLLDEILINHLLCVKEAHLQNYIEACKYQGSLVFAVCKTLRGLEWIPVALTVLLDFRWLAQKADAATESDERILAEMTEDLLSYFRVYLGDVTDENNPVTHILRMYSMIDRYYITYQLNGKRLIPADIKPIENLIEHILAKQPVKKYNMRLLWHLMTAVRDGELKTFEEIVYQNHRFFDNMRLFDVLEILRIKTYRNMIKKIFLGMEVHVVASETQCLIVSEIPNNNIKADMMYSTM